MLNHLKNLDLLVYKSTREEAIKTTKIPKFAFCHYFGLQKTSIHSGFSNFHFEMMQIPDGCHCHCQL